MCIKKEKLYDLQCENCTHYKTMTENAGKCYYGGKLHILLHGPMIVPAYGICNRY